MVGSTIMPAPACLCAAAACIAQAVVPAGPVTQPQRAVLPVVGQGAESLQHVLVPARVLLRLSVPTLLPPPPCPAGYPSSSLWHGRLIPRRTETAWGDMSLVEATRSLLWEAFRDPLNQRWAGVQLRAGGAALSGAPCAVAYSGVAMGPLLAASLASSAT